ncbi:unnamed protein product, partial [Prorocentrum cordatum]
AFLIPKQQSASLDAAVAHFARVAMRGRASWQTERGATRTLTTKGVLRHWRVCETHVELGIRRLNWCKVWSRHPSCHLQLLSALFGSVPWEIGMAPMVDGVLISTVQSAFENIDFTAIRSCTFGSRLLTWTLRAGIYVAVSLAQFSLGSGAASWAPRASPLAMSQAAAARWMQGPSATVKRGADGARGSAPKEKGDLQAAPLKAIAKLCLDDARELANLAGAVYQTWEATEAAGLEHDESSNDLRERQQGGESVDFRARGPPRAPVWGALAMSRANQMDSFLDGSETYKESEKKEFHEYFQKRLAQKQPTDAAKHALHFRWKKSKPKKNQVGATMAAEEKKGRPTFAFSYDEPGREARSLLMQFLNSDKATATQLAGPAPRGPLEREAARPLAIFEKGGKDKDQDQES